jgi:hypothetical protein
MKCPYLMKWITYACKVKEKIYFPSAFQLQEYCKSKGHKKCPFLRRMPLEKERDLISA